MTESLTMTYDAREFARVRNPVLLISAVTWILLLVEPVSMRVFAHCPVTSSGAMRLPASWQMLMTMNPLASLAAGWVLMLVAMMSPVLIPPVRHIRLRSFAHRRARSIVLFVAGYGAMWMAAGVMLLGLVMEARLVAPAPSVAARPDLPDPGPPAPAIGETVAPTAAIHTSRAASSRPAA